MSRPQRASTILETLLALGLVTIVLLDSLYLKYDGGVFLIGAATACLVFWHRPWSWSLLIQVVVTAYFFRCVVLYLTGTDAVKVIAFRDAGLGLVAIGAVCAAKRAISNCAGPIDKTAVPERAAKSPRASDSRLAGQSIEGNSDEIINTPEREADVWSPVQFTVRMFFLLTLVWSGVFAVCVAAGPYAACFVVFLGLLWFLIAGCVRLVSSEGHDS